MRVVIDTNVFVSSFFGGKPRQVIDGWHAGRLTLCLCPSIVDEYVAVLSRLGLGRGGELEELLRWFAGGENVLFVGDPPALRVVEADPDDDKFIACAFALDASHIISGDRHLLDLAHYMHIQIVNPASFLALR
ncbi:MAG: putative toxin-antitoxin system toxin component, PIN family [Deferrisomatales bacterium]|nr:putative toxin-antitoxin system toxin component, PIN family [Deferrisomatales bacterium]